MFKTICVAILVVFFLSVSPLAFAQNSGTVNDNGPKLKVSIASTSPLFSTLVGRTWTWTLATNSKVWMKLFFDPQGTWSLDHQFKVNYLTNPPPQDTYIVEQFSGGTFTLNDDQLTLTPGTAQIPPPLAHWQGQTTQQIPWLDGTNPQTVSFDTNATTVTFTDSGNPSHFIPFTISQ